MQLKSMARRRHRNRFRLDHARKQLGHGTMISRHMKSQHAKRPDLTLKEKS